MISNQVKRNISGTLFIIGLADLGVRASYVAANLSSGMAWFEFISITILTWLCYDNYARYKRLVKRGIRFGNQ